MPLKTHFVFAAVALLLALWVTGGENDARDGTMELADLRSDTIQVLFASGKVVQIGADENVN